MRFLIILSMIAIGIQGSSVGIAFGNPTSDKPAVKIVPQLGHRNGINSVAFSPDGKLALSGGADHRLKLWDVASGREVKTFQASASITSVAFSPDGKLLLSGGGEPFKGELILWDIVSGQKIRSFSSEFRVVNTVAFSPDGKFALSGGSSLRGELKLWDVATGQELRNFTGLEGDVHSVAFSPDGKFALSGGFRSQMGATGALQLWDVATGRLIRSFVGHSHEVMAVAFSPDGRLALSGGGFIGHLSDGSYPQGSELKLWDVASGRELRSFSVPSNNMIHSVAFAPDGRLALSGSWDHTVTLWELSTGNELRQFSGHLDIIQSAAFSPNGNEVLSGSSDGMLKLWDVASGRELKSFSGHAGQVSSVALSRDGKLALSGSCDEFRVTFCGTASLKLWELDSGRELKRFASVKDFRWVDFDEVALLPDGRSALAASKSVLKIWDEATGRETKSADIGWASAMAFSADHARALLGNCDQTDAYNDSCEQSSLGLWDVAAAREIKRFPTHESSIFSLGLSPDGSLALSNGTGGLKLWEVASGHEIWSVRGGWSPIVFSPDGRLALSGDHLFDVESGRELRRFADGGSLSASAFSPDGKLLAGSLNGMLKLWDVKSGEELKSFSGDVSSIAFSSDGSKILSGGLDGAMRLWSLQTGELAAMFASPDGQQLAITRDGFFTASQRDTDMLAIVRGLEVTTIGQVYQSLYNPDLVRSALAGDPDGEVQRAAEVTNLDTVLASGPAPAVEMTSPPSGKESAADLVKAAVRITDRGKGIGRIEWRLNGITAGVTSVPAGPGPNYQVSRELALDPGQNRIEVIAYEGRNLLASQPAQTTIVYKGPANSAKPRLYILAVGINDYVDRGGVDPATGKIMLFPPLSASVPDAKAVSAEMKRAGSGQYGQVRVTLVLNDEATVAKLDETFRKLATEISPRDTFVFYAAAHGYTIDGRYYMIPQDYQGGPDPQAIKMRGIGQDRLQDWIVNRIKAKKALILLDTCESGALTGGYTKPRTETRACSMKRRAGRC